MYCVLLLAVAVILNLSAATTEPSSDIKIQNRNYGAAKKTHNMTFLDKDENLLRMPALSKYFTDRKPTKLQKKSPKRTIQKIIKKNKGKLRQFYFSQVIKQSTKAAKIDVEKKRSQVDIKKWNIEATTQKLHRHKNRNIKVARYHMPFQTLQKKKEEKRPKRGLSRELFILKDLDEIQFLSKEKDNDVISAHVTNYWKV